MFKAIETFKTIKTIKTITLLSWVSEAQPASFDSSFRAHHLPCEYYRTLIAC
jgi:hypothetical protein